MTKSTGLIFSSLLLVSALSTLFTSASAEKRQFFDSLGGMALGKRDRGPFDSLGGMTIAGKRAGNMVRSETLGKTEVTPEKRQFFDSLGGMALGKRSTNVGRIMTRFFEDPRVQHLLEVHLRG